MGLLHLWIMSSLHLIDAYWSSQASRQCTLGGVTKPAHPHFAGR